MKWENLLGNFFKKFLKKRIKRRIILGAGMGILLLAVLFFAFNLYYQNKVFPHTFIGSTNFGGMTHAKAEVALGRLVSQSENGQLNFLWQQKNYTVNISNLEVNYKVAKDQTMENLFAVGRQGSLGKIIQDDIKAIFSRNNISASFNINEGKLTQYLESIANDIDKTEKDASIEIRDNAPVVVPEEIGQKFDLAGNRRVALVLLGTFSFPDPTPFKVTKILPKINRQGAELALPGTQELLGRSLVLKAGDKTFQILPQDMPRFLEFVGRLNQDILSKDAKEMTNIYVLSPEISQTKVYEFIETISADIYQEPKDPKFEVSGGKVVAFQLAQTGYELDKGKAAGQIIEALKTNKKSLDLPVKVTESSISSDNPEEIGLKELIGEGTTNFSGSPQNRRHNISVGANSFDGVLIKPDEEFSMLKYLGPVEASTGYLPELVIKEDRTIPEYGGGLCQVSTTMFRAALNAGLKITERQNHSYRVRYYEPPVGMDATIYIPRPDFRFVNDTGNYILIQAIISGNNLTFQFYGTRDGRRVETTEPYVYDIIGSGEPIYTESPDLAPGEIKRIETAHPGSKATFTYRVYDKNNKPINEQKFDSFYTPWPARYLYGPGTTVPPAE